MMSAGGLGRFTQAYVNINLIRNFHKCMLPIEVYAYGAQCISDDDDDDDDEDDDDVDDAGSEGSTVTATTVIIIVIIIISSN